MTIRKTFLLIALSIILLTPLASHAGAEPCGVKGAIPMQVYIPFISAVGPDPHSDGRPCYYLKPFSKKAADSREGLGDKDSENAGELADYVAGLYFFAVSIGGMVAMVMIIVGGFQWMMAGGNAQGIGKAKEKITNASVGLILLLLSYTILRTINPRLVEFGTIIPGKYSELSFTPPESKTLDTLVDSYVKKGETEISATQKSAEDAALFVNYVLANEAWQAYHDGKPDIIQEKINEMEFSKNVATTAVTNLQKEIERMNQTIDASTSQSEKAALQEDLSKANIALKSAITSENVINKLISDWYFLKTCAETKAAWFTSVDAACPK